MDGRESLWPTHFDKGITDGGHVLGTDEETGDFGFGGGGSEKFDDLCDGED